MPEVSNSSVGTDVIDLRRVLRRIPKPLLCTCNPEKLSDFERGGDDWKTRLKHRGNCDPHTMNSKPLTAPDDLKNRLAHSDPIRSEN